MNTPTEALRNGNRLQRAYYRWALPYYERMDSVTREQAEAFDRFLYTRGGIGAWLGWLCGTGGTAAGMGIGFGMPWPFALGLSLLLWISLTIGGVAAWMKPDAMLSGAAARRVLVLLAVGIVLGGGAGFVVGHWVKHGVLDIAVLAARMLDKIRVLAPALLLTGAGTVLVLWSLAHVSRQVNQRRLERSLLLAERDAAARGAAEANLRLLQAQIQPHFVFNTLATLQHWVDKRDERAGPLLRELTGFLRSSTEMLGRRIVPLADEWQAVGHYLAILQARLGPRLQVETHIDPALARRELPAGLLLTLVENAIEHGLEPRVGAGRLAVVAQPTPDGWSLQVDDDGVGLPGTQVDGVGLSNVRQRLQHHFGSHAHLSLQARDGGGTRALVHVHDKASA